MMAEASTLSPGQRINRAVQAVAMEVSHLRDPAPALCRALNVPTLQRRHGADAFGGIVEFEDALPINTMHGDDGWLALHLAAHFGQTGQDHEAHFAWVYEREDLWRGIARDPLAYLEWAGPDVRDPWTALAAVMEFNAFLTIGDRMPSRLPIHLHPDDVLALMVDALPAGFGLVPAAILRARKAGMVTVDDGAGVYATHAANAWALAYFIRDAGAMARMFGPAASGAQRDP